MDKNNYFNFCWLGENHYSYFHWLPETAEQKKVSRPAEFFLSDVRARKYNVKLIYTNISSL